MKQLEKLKIWQMEESLRTIRERAKELIEELDKALKSEEQESIDVATDNVIEFVETLAEEEKDKGGLKNGAKSIHN